MPAIESPSAARRPAAEILPRHPHREIAELLATAMLRMRAGRHDSSMIDLSEVGLGFTGHQRVHTNPSDTEGVRN
ncbi:hypothetical protein Q3O93_02640 [Ralstonia pseudosolanacearum]|uniref:hypothetical protein n=1 Tax=Ralstonia pseudosolanacearum TaxID=1310165 RepID=UPI00267451C7|nr:hypothetical protein [Ralstonia pseudosolanacearum]MDO3530812.1 hypothetical protein [Ralstonia pseudosolanacearum]